MNSRLSLGGTCVSRSSAVTLLKNHSKTPHCYVILNDEQCLRFATDMGEKVPFEKFAIAKNIQSFAGGDWTFLKVDYLYECEKNMPSY